MVGLSGEKFVDSDSSIYAINDLPLGLNVAGSMMASAIGGAFSKKGKKKRGE